MPRTGFAGGWHLRPLDAVPQDPDIALRMLGQIIALSAGNHQIHIPACIPNRKAANTGKHIRSSHQSGLDHKAASSAGFYQAHGSLDLPRLETDRRRYLHVFQNIMGGTAGCLVAMLQDKWLLGK